MTLFGYVDFSGQSFAVEINIESLLLRVTSLLTQESTEGIVQDIGLKESIEAMCQELLCS